MKLVEEKHAEYKAKQTHDNNKSHRVNSRPSLQERTEVWINNDREKGENTRGEVWAPAVTPRSYIVDTPSGQLRWNSRHLVPVPEEQPEEREGSQNNGIPEEVINQSVVPL